MNGLPTASVTPTRARARRDAVQAALGDDVMVLPSAPVRYATRDADLPYRPDSELFYLTGVTEPGCVAVLVGGESPEWVLFVPEKDADAELWSGQRLGPGEAFERFGPDACYPMAELEERLPGLLWRGSRIHFRLGTDERVERLVRDALIHGRQRGPRTGTGPRGVLDPGGILDELRLRKDEEEIACIRDAIRITVLGHEAGASAVRVGAGEWEVQAAIEAAFRRAGAAGPAFGTIVGAGPNACVLHYREAAARLPEGGLVLIDAGAEVALYNGDLTRTYPAGGRFAPAQREIYDLVDRARLAAIETVAPGATVADVHAAAVRVLTEGLVDLGVLRGDVDELVEERAHKGLYPHQTSHWLGMDVHDPGDYVADGASRRFEEGMVFTVEPGLYFRNGAAAGAEAYQGIGVRIEDDVLVTASGYENLSAALPSAADEVEAMVGRWAELRPL